VRDTFLPIDVDAILRIKLPRQNHDDVIAWLLAIFSVKLAYKLAFNELPIQCNYGASSSSPAGDDIVWKRIWSASVPPKVKHFAWKTASNALATNKLS
jgi:hypothetical protein